jgi:hypothetical protein
MNCQSLPLLFLCLATLACGLTPAFPHTPMAVSPLTPSSTPGPAPVATPKLRAPTIGAILFQDDFSHPNSGWPITDQNVLALAYADGAYRAAVKAPYIASFSAYPSLQFSDISIEADARFVTGASSSLFGLICRLTATPDLQSGYEMIIDPGGDASIVKVTGPQSGQERVLAQGKSNFIKAGPATNHLRMDCSGDRIAIYVNGRQLFDVQDADYARGRVGFAFGTNNNPGFEVRFDSFVVREAAP